MNKVLFVCHGNICRSAMAEFIMKEKIRTRKLEDEFVCESRAVSYEEEGNDLYSMARWCLDRHHIPYTRHYARRIEKEDYDCFDEIYVMDHSNMRNILRIMDDPKCKIKMLNDEVIADPWPCGNYDKTFEALDKGIERILAR